jgi:hydrogenase expression/formation protein HypD
MLRVPGTDGDLLKAKAQGADVRTVYSPLDALKLARQLPKRRVVFFAVGFETTAPANAMAVYQARKLGLKNFFLLCAHVTVPPVMSAILENPDNQIQAFLGPGHVCSVMGTNEYERLSERYHVPIVISGFEPIDLLQGILACVKQLENGEARLENQYARAVCAKGNIVAQSILSEVFSATNRQWRGLGEISQGGLALSEAFGPYDAEREFSLTEITSVESPLCISGEVLRGLVKPNQCPAFGIECTPEHPLGATMVSAEGTCATYYRFGKSRVPEGIEERC